MYSSSNILHDRRSEDTTSYHCDLMFNLDTAGLSTSRLDACSALICSSQLESNPSEDHAARRYQSSPGYNSCSQRDWNRMSGHQAKRERVESIIKGMHCINKTGNLQGVLDGVQESKRTQRRSQRHDWEEEKLEESMNAMTHETKMPEKNFGQLHTTFNCAEGISETKDTSQESLTEDSSDTPRCITEDAFSKSEDPSNRNYHSWQKVNCFHSKPAKLKLMANILKYELSRAVSLSVDSLFKSIPFLQTNEETNTYHPNLFQQSFSPKGVTSSRKADVQSEALSLVVQKPPLERTDKILESKSCGRKAPVLSGQYPEQQRVQVSEEIHGTAHRYYKVDRAMFETQDEPWNTVKVRSKGGSRSARYPQTHLTPRGTLLWENLYLPQVKAECDSLVRNNVSIPNEGLTTSHLKKAKLMFFYTRYPNSFVLKMCFHNVQKREGNYSLIDTAHNGRESEIFCRCQDYDQNLKAEV
ncbi:prospero homeobox protein 1-like [Thalassophryne amazonica]|uniref:prospero homeobox protein 1-like n=1 Tax=Thalassophryne amazonica TaxID=390379 RepID=UPI00147227BA|nr:prospero homeobox protein 1-like [Thalassophryne amazonica]